MTLAIGDKAVYPGQGPCLISRVVKRVVGGTVIRFYHLVLLADRGGELFVPIDKAQAIGIRLVVKRSEVPKLIGRLKSATGTSVNAKQRTSDNLRLFNSGSAFDLAEIVESLTELSDKKSLSLRDSQMLERARKLLVCEISEAMGETRSAVEQQVESALKARKEGHDSSLINGKSLVDGGAQNAGLSETSEHPNRKAQLAGARAG